MVDMRSSMLRIQKSGKEFFLIHQVGEGLGSQGYKFVEGPNGKIALFGDKKSAKTFVGETGGIWELEKLFIDLDEILSWAEDATLVPPSIGAIRRTWYLITLVAISYSGRPQSITEFIHNNDKGALFEIIGNSLEWDKEAFLSTGDCEDIRYLFREGLTFF